MADLTDHDPPDGWRHEPASPFDDPADPATLHLWRCVVGDSSTEVEMYDDELDDFPPLVDARARIKELEMAIRTHREAVEVIPGNSHPAAEAAWHHSPQRAVHEALWAPVATPTGADK